MSAAFLSLLAGIVLLPAGCGPSFIPSAQYCLHDFRTRVLGLIGS